MAALPWRSLSNPVIANARARPMTSRGYGEWPQANKRTMALSVCWLVAVARPTAQQSLTVPAGTVTVSAYFEAQRTQESWQKTSRTTLESLFGTTLGVLRTAMHEEIANRFKAEVDMLKGRCKAVGLVLGLVEPMKAIEDQPIVVENKTASSPKTPLSAADLAAHGNPTGTEHEDGKKAEDAKEEKEAERVSAEFEADFGEGSTLISFPNFLLFYSFARYHKMCPAISSIKMIFFWIRKSDEGTTVETSTERGVG